MAHKLIFSNRFKDDLNKALDYIAQDLDNTNAANRLLNKLTDKISLIVDNPMLYPLYHNDTLAERGFRYTVISKYLLFYIVNEDEKSVELVRFIFGERNIPNMF